MDDPFAELSLPESRVLIIITGLFDHVESLQIIVNTSKVVPYACENRQTALFPQEGF
jgi:hypothetical protein